MGVPHDGIGQAGALHLLLDARAVSGMSGHAAAPSQPAAKLPTHPAAPLEPTAALAARAAGSAAAAGLEAARRAAADGISRRGARGRPLGPRIRPGSAAAACRAADDEAPVGVKMEPSAGDEALPVGVPLEGSDVPIPHCRPLPGSSMPGMPGRRWPAPPCGDQWGANFEALCRWLQRAAAADGTDGTDGTEHGAGESDPLQERQVYTKLRAWAAQQGDLAAHGRLFPARRRRLEEAGLPAERLLEMLHDARPERKKKAAWSAKEVEDLSMLVGRELERRRGWIATTTTRLPWEALRAAATAAGLLPTRTTRQMYQKWKWLADSEAGGGGQGRQGARGVLPMVMAG